jgi:Mrp family chromosome partitioning ATPase
MYNGRGQHMRRDANASIVVVPAGTAVSTSPELLQSTRFDHFIEKTSRAYDLVVLDGSPLLSVSDPLEVAASAEAVLVCIRVQQTTRDQARAVRAALSHLPERPTGAVVTGLRRGDETYEYYYGY